MRALQSMVKHPIRVSRSETGVYLRTELRLPSYCSAIKVRSAVTPTNCVSGDCRVAPSVRPPNWEFAGCTRPRHCHEGAHQFLCSPVSHRVCPGRGRHDASQLKLRFSNKRSHLGCEPYKHMVRRPTVVRLAPPRRFPVKAPHLF